ncbi:MAG: PSCyt1 protein [Bacteroidetes bacterium]|nr:PSCyt1 protein [Bacteroidota bacterium]
MTKTLAVKTSARSCWMVLCTLAVVLFAVAPLGCKDDAPVSAPIDYNNITNIVYSGHVQPLLSATCATSGCHDATTRAAGLALVSWNEIIKGSRYGEVIIPLHAPRSLLTMLFDGTPLRKPHPALGGRTLTNDELLFLKRWINEGAKNDNGMVPFEHAVRKVYCPNQGDDNVAIIDVDNQVVIKYVSVGNSPANDAPHYITADNHNWYVSLIGAGQVWKFDAHTDTLVKTVVIPGSPALLALTPDGSKLYVSQFMTSSTNRVVVLNTSTMTVSKSIPVWTMPHGMRMNNAGTRLYVANMMSDNISVIDVATDSVVETVPVAFDARPFGPTKYTPMELAVSPNDSIFMVTCSEWREVRMFLAATNSLVDSFQVNDQPWHLQFTPDGRYCYVTNRRGNAVSAIHVPMRHVMATVTSPSAFAYPHGIDISADGRYVFVSSENVSHRYVPRYAMEYVGNVCVIDHVTGQVVKVIEVGEMPTGLSIGR